MRTPPGRPVLVLVAVLALATLLGIATTGGGTRGEPAFLPAESGAADHEVDADGGSATPLATPSARSATDAASAQGEVIPARSQRSLALSFVDAASGAPIPELPFALIGESPRLHLVATGVADAEGRAEIDDIVEDLVMVETVRAPPFAVTAQAVWLAGARRGDATVRVMRGSRVVGRVVDDAGNPIAGIDVSLAHANRGWNAAEQAELAPFAPALAPQAVTDERGEYAFEAVASRADGVWLVDGESRPERWLPAHVKAQVQEGRLTGIDVHAGAEREVRAPDLVLDRLRRLQGVVVDTNGNAAVGALVRASAIFARAANADRALWSEPSPVSPERESVTDALGQFQLAVRFGVKELRVVRADGAYEDFEVEDPGSGGARDDLELRLSIRTLLAIELVDTDGARVHVPWETARKQPRNVTELDLPPRAAKVLVGLADDSWRTFQVPPDADGLYRVAFDAPPEDARELSVQVVGWAPARVVVPRGHTAGEPLAVELRAYPRIVVELTAPEGIEVGDQWVYVRACSLDSAEQLDQVQRSFLFFWGKRCCGLGAVHGANARELLGLAALPVLEDRPFYVLVIRLLHVDDAWEQHTLFGPFLPGDAVHRLELGAKLLEPDSVLANRAEREVDPPPDPHKLPPPPSDPGGAAEDDGDVALAIVDALTGDPIEDAGLRLEEVGGKERELWRRVSGGRKGELATVRVPPGEWKAATRAGGYRDSPERRLAIAPGTRMELGVVSLAPLPVLRGRVREDDGRAPPKGTRVTAHFDFDVRDDPALRYFGQEGLRRTAETSVAADGSFAFALDLPRAVLSEVPLDVFVYSESEAIRYQRVSVRAWSEGEVAEIRLAPWTSVVICLHGIPSEERRTDLEVGAGYLDPPREFIQAAEDPPADDGTRTFRMYLGPGKYLFAGGGLLHGFAPLERELEPGRDELRLDVDAVDIAELED